MKLSNRGSVIANATLAVLGALGVVVLAAIVVGIMYVNYSNAEVSLRNRIAAKQQDNQSELDNLQKKLAQSAQVTQEQARALQEVVVGNAEARTNKSGGSLATLVQEAVPNLDQSTYRTLLNIVTGSRDAWTQRQKELLDLKRQHDDLRTRLPSSFFVGSRPEIPVIIVTSGRAKENFRTGEDNDTTLFPAKK